jgi:short-subunit dehydrogenase
MEERRYILVTGAGSGIGRALCSHLAVDKMNVIIALSRNEERLKTLLQSCEDKPATMHMIPFDLEKGNYTELVKKIKQISNTIDILVNNAGALIRASFEETDIKEWRRIYELNFFSAVNLINVLLPLMEGHQSTAHIVNISSMGGFQGSTKFPGLSAYSTSKAALASLTEVLAVEFLGKNIHVNCLALGSVQTDMFEMAFPGVKAGSKAEEVAEMLADFCIKSAGIYNGKILPVAVLTP